jgi:hypothetical protein
MQLMCSDLMTNPTKVVLFYHVLHHQGDYQKEYTSRKENVSKASGKANMDPLMF